MKEKLVNYVTENIEILQNALIQISKTEQKTILLDKKYFNSRFLKDNDISKFEKLLEIRYIKNPVLYWFVHTSTKKNKEIQDAFIEYSDPLRKDFDNANYRYASSYIKGDFTKNNALYVGKVESAFWGRIVTHLGYSKYNTTAGMQLYHWYKPELYGDIILNYIEFEPKMKHQILILEKRLAKDLKPLIGRY